MAITITVLFAQHTLASTFQHPIEGELYTEAIQPELYCLAMNIYHESRAELVVGQYAVADVTINRVYDTRYPNTICGVVMQGYKHASGQMKRNKCQFSWYCDGKSDQVHDTDRWRIAQEVAYRSVKEKKFRGITEGATHYHATYVSPSWRTSLDLVGSIGAHIFYRWSN
jgi:spore germination cell wall hydrolase CwlJ-like protein|tara:strand:- start:1632 stop:2138 length:507 start_codon:yes stop_codon:yes gene_type:complete